MSFKIQNVKSVGYEMCKIDPRSFGSRIDTASLRMRTPIESRMTHSVVRFGSVGGVADAMMILLRDSRQSFRPPDFHGGPVLSAQNIWANPERETVVQCCSVLDKDGRADYKNRRLRKEGHPRRNVRWSAGMKAREYADKRGAPLLSFRGDERARAKLDQRSIWAGYFQRGLFARGTQNTASSILSEKLIRPGVEALHWK